MSFQIDQNAFETAKVKLALNPEGPIEEAFDTDHICVYENALPAPLHERGAQIVTGKARDITDPYSPDATDMSKAEVTLRGQFKADMTTWGQEQFGRLFPSWTYHRMICAIRPMTTQNEPMHYDNTDTAVRTNIIIMFANFDTQPRNYRFGMSLEEAKAAYPEDFAELGNSATKIGRRIRQRSEIGKGPINDSFPTFAFDLQPGGLAVFNANNVAHEIVYGRGVAMMSFFTDDSKAKTQTEVMAAAS